jgi:hypothetical protein
MDFCAVRRRCIGVTLASAFGICPAFAATSDNPPATPDTPAATQRTAPAEIVKPVVPSKAELPDAAFKKLDATGKGYVTLEDAHGLDGFEKAFAAADPRHTGKLRYEQFKKAWTMYSGYKDKE